MKRIGKPAKGKAVAVKVGGKKRSVGQAGVTPKPGTAKGDSILRKICEDSEMSKSALC
jgi:hypothetical protein